MAGEHLIVVSGAAEGQRFELSGETVVIGRDAANDVTVEDTQISRHHARLVRGPEGLVLEDLGSTNGTFVNDARVSGPTVVRAGDLIRVGRVVLRLQAPVPATEIGSADGHVAQAAVAAAPVAAAPPAPPPPPPPPPPPRPAPGGLAAGPEPHGYPEPPAQRAAGWNRLPGERDPRSGLKALRSDAQVRRRAYLLTFVVLALVAAAVVLYLTTR